MNQSRAIKFVVAPWLASVAVATYVARHRMSPSTTSFMYEFWHGSFAPFPPSSLSDLGWPLRAIRLMFGVPWGMQYRLATVFLVLSLIGFVALWRTRRELAPILVGPLLVTLGAAVLQLYPFEGRLVLFLTPAMFVAVAAGTTIIAEWAEARWRHAGALVFLLVALPPAERIIRTPPVYRVQRTRTVLRWIRDHRRPGDLIYVWYRAVPNVAWYGRAFGVAGNDVIAGSCINGGLRRILTETNALRGKPRVWFILTGGSSPDERKLTEYTDAIAIRRAELQTETEYGYYPIEARLYDFSDPTRLARARAATFPIDVRAPTKAQIMSCTHGPLSLHNPA